MTDSLGLCDHSVSALVVICSYQLPAGTHAADDDDDEEEGEGEEWDEVTMCDHLHHRYISMHARTNITIA